jgi:anti-sigma factor RsiW
MSSCETVDLVGYMEGALEAGESLRVEGHMAGCEACRRSLEELSETSEWLVELFSASGEGCPPAEALAEYMAGEGEEASRRVLARHTEACSACSELMEFLRAFEAEWVAPEESLALADTLAGRLSTLAEGALAERLKKAAEAALGAEGPAEGRKTAEWIERILEPGPEAWPRAALPRDAADTEEEEPPTEEEPPA